MNKTNKMIAAGVCLLFLFFYIEAVAAITEQEAVEIAGQSQLVRELLETSPDAKPTVSQKEYQNKSIFSVFWWTKETTEMFHHPNILVSVDAETGDILFEGTAKGESGTEEPAWDEDTTSTSTSTSIFIIGFVAAAIAVALIFVFVWNEMIKRR